MPLRPAPCPKAIRTIKKAFDDLSQAISPNDARNFSTIDISDVREAALKIETQLAAKQQLRNTNRLRPLFSGMEHYAKVMDILCNGTPFLSWIWAPITLILRVSSEHVEAFEKIIKGYAQMAEPLQRFAALGQVFSQNEHFQQTLAIFYADILEFHRHAYVFVNRSGWRLLFLTSWGRFQRRFNGILDDMTRHEALIDKEANARNILESKKMRDELWSWREETRQSQLKTALEESLRQLHAIKSWLQADESDQLAIYNSVVTDADKYPGTCSWLSSDPIIRSFLDHQASQTLVWLQGIPGSGKTVLFSQLISFMNAASMPIIHHFCSHKFASSLAYDQILQLLILSIVRRDPDLTAYVHENMVVARKTPTKSVLQKALLELLSISSHVLHQTDYLWFLFDGINECPKDQQASLIHLVKLMIKAAKSSGLVLKILLTSRQASTLAPLLKKSHILSLSDRKVKVDQAIREYARCRLLAINSRLEEIAVVGAVRESIESCIVEKSDGMFLYAKLVIDYITSNIFYSAPEMMSSVRALPEKLSDFYQKILSQILRPLDERSTDRLRVLCGWVAFAERPLVRHELLSAMSFGCEAPYFTSLVPSFILEVANPLIEEKRDKTFAFIHISLKEFLQSSSIALRINGTDALEEHTKAMIGCLLYGMKTLSKDGDHDMLLRVIRGFHGLHLYATRYWAEYLLCYFSKKASNEHNQSLIQAGQDLAGHLNEFSVMPVTQDDLTCHHLLHHLASWPDLQMHITREVLKRPQTQIRTIEDEELDSEATEAMGHDGIESTRDSYQLAIRTLLSRSSFAGVTSEQFEAFKAQYRTTAFTCRFPTCPYASKGFATMEDCHRHQSTHVVQLKCNAPHCQYPSFSSRKALSRHMMSQHRAEPPRRQIRRVQAFSHQTSVLTSKEQNLDNEVQGFRGNYSDPSQNQARDFNDSFGGPASRVISLHPPPRESQDMAMQLAHTGSRQARSRTIAGSQLRRTSSPLQFVPNPKPAALQSDLQEQPVSADEAQADPAVELLSLNVHHSENVESVRLQTSMSSRPSSRGAPLHHNTADSSASSSGGLHIPTPISNRETKKQSPQITPEEMAIAKQHEKFKGWPEDKIRVVLMHIKMEQKRKRHSVFNRGEATPASQFKLDRGDAAEGPSQEYKSSVAQTPAESVTKTGPFQQLDGDEKIVRESHCAAGDTQNLSMQDLNRLQIMMHEEYQAFGCVVRNDIYYSDQAYRSIRSEILDAAAQMRVFMPTFLQWYSFTRDDSRAKIFFRERYRLLLQFTCAMMYTVKGKLSVTRAEVRHISVMLDIMTDDIVVAKMSGK